MHGVTTFALTGALLLSAAAAQTTTNGTTSNSTLPCADGLKMFVSRGTGEDQSTGVIGKITDLIASQIKGSDVQGVAYPATFEDPNYFLSVSNGTQLLRQAIVEYSQACPDSKISLFGYSQVSHVLPQHQNTQLTYLNYQGAQTTSNVLCGQPVVWAFDASNGLESDLGIRQLAQTFINAQPLPQNFTTNGAYPSKRKNWSRRERGGKPRSLKSLPLLSLL